MIVARLVRKIAHESALHILVLRQYRANDEAGAAGQLQYVDQLRRIAMQRVDHGTAPARDSEPLDPAIAV
jgi:hypothetical protein